MPRPKKEKPNRGDGRYEVKICVGEAFDGRKIMKSFYSRKSKEDARAKTEQYKIDKAVADATGEPPAAADMPFDRWARRVMASFKGTVKGSTYDRDYRIPVEKHLIPYFGRRRISSIRQIDIQGYFNAMQDVYALATLQHDKSRLNQIFKAAVQNDMISRNPCTGIRIVSHVRPVQKHTYTQEQCDLVLAYAHTHRYGLDIVLLLSYGISRSELLGLQWQDVDAEGRILYIRRGVTTNKDADTGEIHVEAGATKNRFRQRAIPISGDTVAMLMQQERTSRFIFPDTDGQPLHPDIWAYRHFSAFMRDMHAHYLEQGIDVPILHAHELRHTRATLWVNGGANLFAVADVLGHADLSMLRKRYAHSDVEATRKLLDIDGADEN